MNINKRPRLNEALQSIKLFIIQGYAEAAEALDVYNEIKQSSGEFTAGRYIIEVVMQINQELKELKDAKG
jgi:hypothetical protein